MNALGKHRKANHVNWNNKWGLSKNCGKFIVLRTLQLSFHVQELQVAYPSLKYSID